MQVARANPYVWYRLASGRLSPPTELLDPTKGLHEPRLFEVDPSGAVTVQEAEYPEPPTFRAERGDVIHDWG